MVDFAKLRAERAAAVADLKGKPVTILPKGPSYLQRFNHLISFHLAEMTAWEETFSYSNRNVIIEKGLDEAAQERFFTDRVKTKLKELEDTYCGSMCHALDKNGIGHN